LQRCVGRFGDVRGDDIDDNNHADNVFGNSHGVDTVANVQVAEKRAHSMEAATEFVQGGQGGAHFAKLLADVMHAADRKGDGDARSKELAKLQQMVRCSI
jgi:hypothetical protein